MGHPRQSGEKDKALGRSIKRRRIELEMSQDALGKTLGVSFQQVQKYETGSNRVTCVRLLDIARALQCDASVFLAEIESKGGKKPSKAAQFIASSDGERLIKAVVKIKDPDSRRRVVEFAETLQG
jgi:transcriptional regulator with XRE-family HTH domain